MPAARKKKVVRRRRKRLSPEAIKAREAAIIADLRAGRLSYRLIAEKHHVSLPTVNAKARKAGISRPRGRRPAGVTVVAMKKRTVRPRRKRATAAKKAVRRGPRRAGRQVVKMVSARLTFQDAFREMVLHFYPRLTLAKFDRLAKMVAKSVS